MTPEAARVAALRDHPKFRAACEALRAGHARMVEEIVQLTEIPAPPFGEGPRARAYLAMLEEAGLAECREDEVGNVMGLRRGTGNGDTLVVAAHLDTVFPAGTDVRVRREGTKLFAPGVGDDTRGLAVNLAFLRAMDAAGVRTRHDILVVGDVGEEGLGDLRGVRHLFAAHPSRDRFRAFLTVDSPDVDRIVTGGIGSRRYRVTFRGPGGHSFANFGLVNPVYALAEAARALGAVRVPREPVTTHSVSVVAGGTSVNAIPETAVMEVDLRSASEKELAKLDARFREIVREAGAAENAAREGGLSVEIERVGDRPAGHTPNGSPIARLAAACVAGEGFSPAFEWSSTDANIPMSLGIPALRVGSGGRGGRAHSLEEWIDVEIEESLRGMRATLATILALAEVEG
jgi:acetylornithine deacetylase/succinyl-diaminopimelate desuccinylase-like protein